MQTRTSEQNAAIIYYCAEFQALAENYLVSKTVTNKSVFSFFKPRSNENNIAHLLLEITSPVINLPMITLIDNIIFLKKISTIYFMIYALKKKEYKMRIS